MIKQFFEVGLPIHLQHLPIGFQDFNLGSWKAVECGMVLDNSPENMSNGFALGLGLILDNLGGFRIDSELEEPDFFGNSLSHDGLAFWNSKCNH